jgi:hypothetical protein
VTALIAQTRKLDASCPPPTQRDNGGNCVLDRDWTISETLELGSFAKLNCKGHKIFRSGIDQDGHSVPEVAIAIVEAREAKLQNCVIGTPDERFDFGVVILASKALPTEPVPLGRNKVLGNELRVRAAGVLLMGADDNVIADNFIEWDGSGVGIDLLRDADRTLVLNNVLTSTGGAGRVVRGIPGTNDASDAILDTGVFTADVITSRLFNVVIGGRVLQFPAGPRLDDNVIEGNTVTLPGPHAGKNHGGIVTAGMASRTIIRGNTVNGGRPGIRFSGGVGGNIPLQLPKQCTGDSSRYCLSDSDCLLFGVEAGSCPPLDPGVFLEARALGALAEGNTLNGPFGDPGGTAAVDCAIGPFGGTVGAVVRENHIFAAGTSYGIVVQGQGLRDSATNAANSGAVITRNVIVGARTGLNLRQQTPAATVFGARISRNDIVDSLVTPVSSFGAWTLASELSVDDQGRVCGAGSTGCVGNYWQHDEAQGFRATDTNDALIHDSNPFCQPVAGLVGLLPATCP